ncbi:MAG: PAS domain S-box protein [Candidatus Bathyarchaeia archaeon]
MVVEISDLAASNKKNVIRVLHVDDDPSILELSKLILMDMGNFEIDNACCVDEAFKKLSAGHFDVIISDYEMPQKDGLQFLSELRKQDNNIPFILFTGKGREEVAIKALNLGADGYINKQGSPETVYGELAHGIRTSFRHRKSNELLRKSQAELNAIVYNAPIGIATSDSNMLFKSANVAFCRIVGYSEDELQKRSFRDITYPDDVEVSNKDMKELSCGNIPYFSQEKRYVRKDGSIIDGKVTVSAIRNNEGKPVLYVAELEDITQRKQAEAELRETFNVLERVGEGIDAGLAVIGKDYRVIWANKLLMNLGVGPNKKCYQTFNHSESVCADCGVKKIFQENISLDVHEYKTVNSKGETMWVELRVTPLKDSSGSTIGALELAVPITERKKAEHALQVSEAKYRQIIDVAEEGIWMAKLNGVTLFVNPKMANMLGYSPEDFVGKVGSEFLAKGQEQIVIQTRKELDDNMRIQREYQFLRNDGTTLWTIGKVTPIFDENGQHIANLAMHTDITERKKAEFALVESEEHFRNLAEELPNMVFIDQEDKVVYANKKCEEIMGYAREELYSSDFRFASLISPEYIQPVRLGLAKSMRGEASSPFEFVLITKEGKRINALISSTLIDYKGDKAILGIVTDITERKKAEEKVLWLASFPMLNPNPVLEVSFEGNISYFNSATESVFPDLKKAGLSHPLFSGWNDLLATFRNEKTQTLGRNIKINDNWFHLQFNVHIETQQVRIYVTNITKAKLAEKALRENETKFRLYVENSPVAVFVANTEGKYEYVNEAASKLLGYSAKEFMGMSIPQVTFVGEPKVFSEVKNTGRSACETVLRSKDGLPVFVILNSVRLPDGKLMAFCENITERKKAEQKLRENHANIEAVNEKLRVVGSLTRHDVGNKIMSAKANLYLLKKRVGVNPDLAKYFEGVESALAASDRIFEYSRLYERIGVEKPSEENVFECFNQAVTLMPFLGSVKVVNECQGLNVLADSLLRQLFYNFIDDSLKHGEKVTQIRLHYTKDVGGVKLFYEDNGVGVPDTNKLKLFNEGFSTSGSTGFGLFLTKMMMDVYGWKIEENGEPGKGAKFVMTIPKLNNNGKENYRIVA